MRKTTAGTATGAAIGAKVSKPMTGPKAGAAPDRDSLVLTGTAAPPGIEAIVLASNAEGLQLDTGSGEPRWYDFSRRNLPDGPEIELSRGDRVRVELEGKWINSLAPALPLEPDPVSANGQAPATSGTGAGTGPASHALSAERSAAIDRAVALRGALDALPIHVAGADPVRVLQLSEYFLVWLQGSDWRTIPAPWDSRTAPAGLREHKETDSHSETLPGEAEPAEPAIPWE